jgi:hypothetical protein
MPPNDSQQVNLQTLVATVQGAVNAQNLIATNIAKLTTAFNTAFPPPKTGSANWTPGGIANNASASISFPITGVTLGGFAKASLGEDLKGCAITGYVQAAGTVFAVIQNNTGATVTFAATTVNISVTAS